jgi:hypothetical protein
LRHKDERDLRGLLRDEAAQHRPDSAAMWNRIDRDRPTTAPGPLARGMADLFRPNLLRPVGAAVAVAAMLVAGVTGIRLANRSPAPQQVAAAPTEPSAAPSKPTVKKPTSPPAGHSSTPSHSQRPSPAATGGGHEPVHDEYLSATAVRNAYSITSWTQDDLTLGTTETITALDVTLKVALTAGVADTGHWTSIPVELVTTGVTRQGGALVYRFTLRAGATLAPGSYTFAAQFNHTTDPRPLTVDTYTAKSTASRTATVAGNFTK